MLWCVHGVQRTTCKSPFCLSTRWVWGIKFRLGGKYLHLAAPTPFLLSLSICPSFRQVFLPQFHLSGRELPHRHAQRCVFQIILKSSKVDNEDKWACSLGLKNMVWFHLHYEVVWYGGWNSVYSVYRLSAHLVFSCISPFFLFPFFLITKVSIVIRKFIAQRWIKSLRYGLDKNLAQIHTKLPKTCLYLDRLGDWSISLDDK